MEGIVDVDDSKIEKLLQDSALREELGIGKFTGPKGVRSDALFHQKQEKLRHIQKVQAFNQSLSSSALSSGWLQRQIESETKINHVDEQDDDEDDIIRQLESDINDYPKETFQVPKKLIGSLIKVSHSELLHYIDQDMDTTVFVHITNQSIKSQYINRALKEISPRFPCSLFLSADKHDIEFICDDDVMPAILVYRNGELFTSLIAFYDDIKVLLFDLKVIG